MRQYSREQINDYLTSMYDDEVENLNRFLAKHEHIEPDNLAPTRFTLKFTNTSVATIPSVKCWCGAEEILSDKERYDNI